MDIERTLTLSGPVELGVQWVHLYPQLLADILPLFQSGGQIMPFYYRFIAPLIF